MLLNKSSKIILLLCLIFIVMTGFSACDMGGPDDQELGLVIEEVYDLEDLYVNQGTEAIVIINILNDMRNEVKVLLNDSSEKIANVVWEEEGADESYDPEMLGNYEFTGKAIHENLNTDVAVNVIVVKEEVNEIKIFGRQIIYVPRERGGEEEYLYEAELKDQTDNIMEDEKVEWELTGGPETGVYLNEVDENKAEIKIYWDAVPEEFEIIATSMSDPSIETSKIIKMDYLSEREENVYQNAFDNLDNKVEELNLNKLTEDTTLPEEVEGYDSAIDEHILFDIIWNADDHTAITIDNSTAVIERVYEEDIEGYINAFIQPAEGEPLGLAADPRQKHYKAIILAKTAELVEVEAKTNFYFDYGTEKSEVLDKLEEEVSGKLSDGSKVMVKIEWDFNHEYDSHEAGFYTFEGEVFPHDRFTKEFEIPDELSTIKALVTVNSKQTKVEENEETDIEEIITVNEEPLTDSSLNVSFFEEVERSLDMQFEKTPDAILYRIKGNEWFKYARYEELEAGKVNVNFDSLEVEVLPIKLKDQVNSEVADFNFLANSSEGFNIIEIKDDSFKAEVGYLEGLKNLDNFGYVLKKTTGLEEEKQIDKEIEGSTVVPFKSKNSKNVISEKNLKNGRHTIYIVGNESLGLVPRGPSRVFWEQDIYINYVNLPSDIDKEELAEKFAPFIFFNSKEEYFPMKVEEIFGGLKIDLDIKFDYPVDDKEIFVIYDPINHWKSLTLDTAEHKMNNFGHRRAEFKYEDFSEFRSRRGSLDDITIYYSLIERGNNYYLNYHMLYAFDPKSSEAREELITGEHILDRESATVVLDQNLDPLKIVYGAHLDNQDMGIVDGQGNWSGGGIDVDWNESLRVGKHPVLSIAEGSHAVYPVPEHYKYAAYEKIPGGTEIAGDWSYENSIGEISNWNENIAYPPAYAAVEKIDNTVYELENILDEYRSDSSPLHYSGYFTTFFGSSFMRRILNQYSYFPPFTIREVNPETYIDNVGNGFDFEVSLNKLEEYSFEILTKHLLPEFHKAIQVEIDESTNKLSKGYDSFVDDIEISNNYKERPEIIFGWESPVLAAGGGVNSLPDGYLVKRRDANQQFYMRVGGIRKIFDDYNKALGYGIYDSNNNLLNRIEVNDKGKLNDGVFSFVDRAFLEEGKEYVYSVEPFTIIEGYNDQYPGLNDYVLAEEYEELGPFKAIGEDKIIAFECFNLEQDIREAIDKSDGDLYLSDVIDLKELSAGGREEGIRSFEGIQHLINLEKLSFVGYHIEELGPIGELRNLIYLSFGAWEPTNIEDLSPLSNLENLEYLYMAANITSDISPIKNLTNLKELSLWRNANIEDISALEDLINLEYLNLRSNQIKDIYFLKNLTNLEHLDFGNNQVEDISVLSNLIKLEFLHFGGSPLPSSGNLVEDISALKHLPNLKYLNFYDNQVGDITPIVENDNISYGNEVDMRLNYLDLSDGSKDINDIQELIDRDVEVEYEPQQEIEKDFTYKGRVVIEGDSPGQPIIVRITEGSPENPIKEIETDSKGYFTIFSNLYEVDDVIAVSVSSFDNFEEDYIRARGLITWVHLDSFTIKEGNWNLPELDMYNYGFELVKPEHGDTVSTFPYEGEINKYNGNVDEYYWLYFYDFESNWIGYGDLVFGGETYIFDGRLTNGSYLEQDAIWYVSAVYHEGSFRVLINTWGNAVYSGETYYSEEEMKKFSSVFIENSLRKPIADVKE